MPSKLQPLVEINEKVVAVVLVAIVASDEAGSALVRIEDDSSGQNGLHC